MKRVIVATISDEELAELKRIGSEAGPEELYSLADDINPYVIRYVLSNPNTPEEALRIIVDNYLNFKYAYPVAAIILEKICKHPNLTTDMLMDMARSGRVTEQLLRMSPAYSEKAVQLFRRTKEQEAADEAQKKSQREAERQALIESVDMPLTEIRAKLDSVFVKYTIPSILEIEDWANVWTDDSTYVAYIDDSGFDLTVRSLDQTFKWIKKNKSDFLVDVANYGFEDAVLTASHESAAYYDNSRAIKFATEHDFREEFISALSELDDEYEYEE